MDRVVIPRVEGILERVQSLKKELAAIENALIDTATMAKSWREVAIVNGIEVKGEENPDDLEEAM